MAGRVAGRMARVALIMALVVSLLLLLLLLLARGARGARLRDFLRQGAEHERGPSPPRTWAAAEEARADEHPLWVEVSSEVSDAWAARWEAARERETVASAARDGAPRMYAYRSHEVLRQQQETLQQQSPAPQIPGTLHLSASSCVEREARRVARTDSDASWASGPQQMQQLVDVMRRKSVFVAVSPTSSLRNTLVERFYNGHKWVFVRHFMGPDTDAVQVFTWQNRVYVISAQGSLLERRRTRGERLEWYAMTGLRLTGAVKVSPRRRSSSAFFLTRDGRVLERRGSPPEAGKEVAQGAREDGFFKWISYEIEYESVRASVERLVGIVDAEGLEPSRLLFASERGVLLRGTVRFRSRVISVEVVNAPSTARLQAAPGVLSNRNLIVTTIQGDLMQISQGTDGSHPIKWSVYEKPKASFALSGGLGPMLGQGRAIFAVSRRGELLIIDMGAARVQWWSHGCPVDPRTKRPVRLREMAARQLDEASLAFFTEDDRLAFYLQQGDSWVWTLTELPELGDATYCVAERNRANSCMPVDPASLQADEEEEDKYGDDEDVQSEDDDNADDDDDDDDDDNEADEDLEDEKDDGNEHGDESVTDL